MVDKHAQREAKDLGFGNAQQQKVRLVNKDGSFNVIRKGMPFRSSFNFYHWLLNLSWLKFMFLIVAWFTAVNLFFTVLYVAVGVQHLQGLDVSNNGNMWIDAFFFSTQTFTTVGYGRINPIGLSANIISSFEALVGLMSFAIITGLLYGRFSMPESRLIFSEKALVAPYREMKAVMFRIANMQKSQLLDVQVDLSVSMFENKNGVRTRSFYSLNLERNTLIFFPSSWTVVHPIDEQSPFYGMSQDEFNDTEPEFLFNFKAFDDIYKQMIYAANSYVLNEVVWGAKYTSMLGNENGWPVVYVDMIDKYNPAALPDEGTNLHPNADKNISGMV